MNPATAPTQASDYTSTTRLARVKELWIADKANREEIGRLLYEERSERLSVGGAGNHTGFHQWLRDAGISKQSAYRRIAEYESSIGVRDPEDAYDISPTLEPVPNGTRLSGLTAAAPAGRKYVPVEPMPVYKRAQEPGQEPDMCPVCIEHPHRVNERPFDYSKHPELQTVTTSRSHGMGLERLRKLAGDGCSISFTDGRFKVIRTMSFETESDAKKWIERTK